MEEALTPSQQQDADAAAVAAAAAAAAAAAQLGLGDLQPEAHAYHQQGEYHQQDQTHEYHQQQDYPPTEYHHPKDDAAAQLAQEVDVHALEIPVEPQDVTQLHQDAADLDLSLSIAATPHVEPLPRTTYRPPSIRKACDLCHSAKQKCSGDRPSCTRCAQGGWRCVYAPRQRRRTVPKDQKLQNALDGRGHLGLGPLGKKRKLQRDSLLGGDAMDMRMAMGMAMDLGLAEEDDDDQMLTMTDEQMLESIAIDGYLADLPLATFVHNLPYNSTQATAQNTFSNDYSDPGDGGYSAEMDQHTTSALRDAIFSLNESSNAAGQANETGADGTEGHDQQGLDNMDQQGLDPHLALLDLSHAMPVEDGQQTGSDADLGLNGLASTYQPPCAHVTLVPRVLALLSQHPLEPKPGSNTPLSMYIFAPLARSLRLFHSVVQCTHCCSSPQQTLPQLALLSRTTTVLTFPVPAPQPSAAGTATAQLTVHGARLSGTGISEAIEAHIVGVVWDSWRASVREIFNAFERKAQEVIQQNAQLAAEAGGQPPPSSAETQRAGLMFQAMSRLVSAMNEVERD